MRRRSLITSDGLVVATGEADGPIWISHAATVVAIRVGDWVVGPDGPRERPAEIGISAQTFASPGSMTVTVTYS